MRGVFKILLPILAVWLVWGCERDYMFRGGNDGVRFSVDTVMFDTIFTSLGSTTKHFRVYNHYGSDMLIDTDDIKPVSIATAEVFEEKVTYKMTFFEEFDLNFEENEK